MTPEEAIKELREASDSEVRYGDTDNHYNEVMKRVEAFDMAIKALEEVSRLPENLHREREQAYMNGYADAKSTCKKSAYDDAVERIEKSTFTLHDGLDCVETLVALEAVMIASGQTKPCEDCTVMKKLSKKYYVEDAYGYTDEDIVNKVNEIIDVVNELSSVTPTRPIGHWINLEKTKYKGLVLPFWCRYGCSKCGGHGEGTFNYCPNCGCRMGESEGEQHD